MKRIHIAAATAAAVSALIAAPFVLYLLASLGMWIYLALSLTPRPWDVRDAPLPALHAAVVKGDDYRVRQRLHAGDDIDLRATNNAVWPDGVTPLMIAVAMDDPELVELLLSNGATVETELPGTGARVIHFVTSKDCLPVLLQYGADINARNHHGQTPLMEAAIGAHISGSDVGIVSELIEAGADVTIRDNQGRDIVQILHTWPKVDRRVLKALGEDTGQDQNSEGRE